MKFSYSKAIVFCSTLLLPALAMAQTSGTLVVDNKEVPFINLTPDSRSGAMGEAGVALSPDVNANYWNPAKLAFLQNDNDVSLSYSPWLRQLIPDISLSYLSYAHKIDERSAFGASLRYFNYGSVPLTDGSGNHTGDYNPYEFQITGSYSRKFGDDFSLAVTGGYIHSNYSSASSITSSGQASKAGNAISAGVSLYYTKPTQEFGSDAVFSFGTNISNLGSKISYSDNGVKYFLPANLKLGIANTINLDDFNQITLAFDVNKLLTPVPPIRDGSGNIIAGKDDNVSVPAGVFGSFGGTTNGFTGVLQEFTLSPGIEYWYSQTLALRAGYFYENAYNPYNIVTGGTHYATVGVGFKYQEYHFDFSYIAASQSSSPLANTLRFTLIANFGGDKNASKR